MVIFHGFLYVCQAGRYDEMKHAAWECSLPPWIWIHHPQSVWGHWARPGIVGSKNDWLVGGWPTPLKNMKVWLDHHPNYWGKYGKWWMSCSSHHQPVEVDEVNSQEDAEQKASRRTNPQWPPPPSWRAQQLPVLRAKSAAKIIGIQPWDHRDFQPGRFKGCHFQPKNKKCWFCIPTITPKKNPMVSPSRLVNSTI